MPPSDIPNVGEFAIVQDPTGPISVSSNPDSIPVLRVFWDVGALCWADLNSTDPEKAAKSFTPTGSDGRTRQEKMAIATSLMGRGHENMIGGICQGCTHLRELRRTGCHTSMLPIARRLQQKRLKLGRRQ
jgi:hypothetical protein